MVETRLIDGPLEPLINDDSRLNDGAEVIFHGRVRQREGEHNIVALDYEHYPQMAEQELRRVAQGAVERFSVSDLRCWHRVGRVPVGQASLRVSVFSRHRAEALEALAWLITELKRRVPIWKWAVLESGAVFPCGPCSGCNLG